MKKITLFVLEKCPFCQKALRYIDEAKAENPAFNAIEIEIIDEGKEPELADTYDYYYVPTFYFEQEKIHEGGIYPPEVKEILTKALE